MPSSPAGYRISELSLLSGVSIRNIREYQDRGILPPPRREGRVALYDDGHVARLQLVVRLLGRGYPLAVIRDLVEAWSGGRDLQDVLGLASVAQQPWSDEPPGSISSRDLAQLGRGQLDEHAIARLRAIGVVHRARHGYTVPSPRLLAALPELLDAGVPLGDVLAALEGVRADLQSAADQLVQMVTRRLLPADAPQGLPAGEELSRVTAALERLRPRAAEAAAALFADAMRRAAEHVMHDVARRALVGPAVDDESAAVAEVTEVRRAGRGARRASSRRR